MAFVSEERKHHIIYPPAEEVFSWTQMCDIQDVGYICSLGYSFDIFS